MMPTLYEPKPLGIYIHYPFCIKKCPYCDFNSYVHRSLDDSQYAQLIAKELDYYASNYTLPLSIESLFFGGGTPSLIDPTCLDKILTKIFRTFPKTSTNVEISLEANPTTFEFEKFKAFRGLGINRLSLGVQALSDVGLKFLGRNHDVNSAVRSIEEAMSIFENLSFDLIYGRKDHDLQGWMKELEQAITYKTPHLSCYQLTIEENTPFKKRFDAGEPLIPCSDTQAEFYEFTTRMLEEHGYHIYEISNAAKEEFYCKHNLGYWKYHDYLGLGPGAHGRFLGCAWVNEKNPIRWAQNVETHHFSRTKLSQKDMQQEHLLVGLRLKEGVRFHDVSTVIDQNHMDILIEEGFLTIKQHPDHDQLALTPKGRLCLNSVINFLCVSHAPEVLYRSLPSK